MFAIVDVETTGLSAKNEKITEIAIVLHDGKQLTDSYHSLVNPEKNIPYQITQLTGISNQMVQSAPKFYEIAKKIIEMTENRILIGHNVRFDYSFLQKEFQEFEYVFNRKTLCTVKTARKVIPGQTSYSLSKLTAQLGIPHLNKHRALGDAQATAALFELLLSTDPSIAGDEPLHLPDALDRDTIKKLPRKTGVYYFSDALGNIIYVGKSIDIHQRIVQHLNNYSTRRSIEMLNNIHQIEFELTGSELVALLLESEEIKRINPLYNRAQRRSLFHYCIFKSVDKQGYYRLSAAKNTGLNTPLAHFQTMNSAKDFLFRLVEEYELCQKLSGLYQSEGACFDYQIHRCRGACIGKESAEDYNQRFKLAEQSLQFHHPNFFIIDKGPEQGLKSVIQIQNGLYKGYGIVKEQRIGALDDLISCINPKVNNRDTHQIIQSFLRQNHPSLLLY
jgi:DNA polymerase-3 subunit epsilon